MNINFDDYKGKAIHCATEKEANKLLKELDKNGWRWCGEQCLLEENNFNSYQEQTCYRLYPEKRITFTTKEHFIREHVEIIEFSQLFSEFKPRILEILGVDFDEEFKFTDNREITYTYKITKGYFPYVLRYKTRNGEWEEDECGTLIEIINNSEKIVHRPQLTDNEKEIINQFQKLLNEGKINIEDFKNGK